ncbi:GNAT family N-acetyltransferase [Alicyclobacillus fastidiosus]|uniref:GNAT family N-acetyltransferase n=1 Tax=Alicyclobacillus fastidiosus TaxID=392011 RepID=UPI0034DD70D1
MVLWVLSPPDQQGNVEIGYDIIPEYQGRGYATEMAKAFIRWTFEETPILRGYCGMSLK